ncbi:hypothetical protein GCM10008922_46710 [Faecalicatena contorta]|nr:hypothetical protein CE91St64_41890 [Faecalicatena contorta]
MRDDLENGHRGVRIRVLAVSLSQSKEKRKKKCGDRGHIAQSLDGFARWGQEKR